MSKVSIVYIGQKLKKKDTVTGSRLIFTRNKSLAVDEDVAAQLLDYPDVWVPEADAKKAIEKQETLAKAVAKDEQKKQDEQALRTIKESMDIIDADGEKLDIGKYSSGQLNTLVEAEGLTITTKKNPVPAYRLAIRDALREKNGTPEVEETE